MILFLEKVSKKLSADCLHLMHLLVQKRLAVELLQIVPTGTLCRQTVLAPKYASFVQHLLRFSQRPRGRKGIGFFLRVNVKQTTSKPRTCLEQVKKENARGQSLKGLFRRLLFVLTSESHREKTQPEVLSYFCRYKSMKECNPKDCGGAYCVVTQTRLPRVRNITTVIFRN